MNVISNSEAAKLAGVSRQAINDLKRVNACNKKKYPFFVFNPETGKPGVNIDHKEWYNYLNRNQGKRVKRKSEINKPDCQVDVNENVKSVNVNNENMIQAVAEILQQELRLPKTEMNKIFNKIEKRYKELENE